MRVVRVIELCLNVDDPISVYSSASANFMSILTNQFKGSCIRGCRIEKILQIKKISECVLETRGEQCTGKVNIIVEVEATVFTQGEVIIGCTVRHKDQGMIVANHPVANVWLKSHEKFASVRLGQLIAIVVGGTSHAISSTAIGINAIPYLPKRNTTGYRIDGVLTEEDRQALSIVIARVDAEEQLMAEFNEKKPQAIDFFNKLIYPYKAEMSVPTGAKKENIKSLLAEDAQLTGWYVRDKRIKPIDPSYYVFDENPNDPNIEFDECDNGIQYAVSALLDDYAQNLRIVREFAETYNTKELLTNHANLWTIYHSVKT